MHDDRKNTYSQSLKGKHIMLAPMKEKVETRIEKRKELVVFITVYGRYTGERVVYALVLSSGTIKEDDDVDDNPSKVKVVLTKLLDLMPDYNEVQVSNIMTR
jgi:hypothetical protein